MANSWIGTISNTPEYAMNLIAYENKIDPAALTYTVSANLYFALNENRSF